MSTLLSLLDLGRSLPDAVLYGSPEYTLAFEDVFPTPEIIYDTSYSQTPQSWTGGLGTLAGNHLRAMNRLGVPGYLVGPLPRHGDYLQEITQGLDGPEMFVASQASPRWAEYVTKTDGVFAVKIAGNNVGARVYLYPGHEKGSRAMLLVDTDRNENPYLDKLITRWMYGGSERFDGKNIDREVALAVVLGAAVVRVPELLGVPPKVYRLQESWMALAIVFLVGMKMDQGMGLEDAIAATRLQVVSTNHTPIPAGNKTFPKKVLLRIGKGNPGFTNEVLERLGGVEDGNINLTHILLRGSRIVNAVSKRHLQTISEMFRDVPDKAQMISITNGFDDDWLYPGIENVDTVHDYTMFHHQCKARLTRHVHALTGRQLDAKKFTVCFGKRLIGYKRAGLVMHDFEWFQEQIGDKLQLVISARPNPDDVGMIGQFNHFLRLSERHQNLIVLPKYDLDKMRWMQAGGDGWLNNPHVPEECGSSGMKSLRQGVLNFATRDGWNREVPDELYFPFGTDSADVGNVDAYDAGALRETLIRGMDMYYNHHHDWSEKALAGIKWSRETGYLSATRMVSEYCEQMYGIALLHSS